MARPQQKVEPWKKSQNGASLQHTPKDPKRPSQQEHSHRQPCFRPTRHSSGLFSFEKLAPNHHLEFSQIRRTKKGNIDHAITFLSICPSSPLCDKCPLAAIPLCFCSEYPSGDNKFCEIHKLFGDGRRQLPRQEQQHSQR
jgi:hypothetical protein